MAEGSSPKQSLMSRDVTDDSQKEMRNHRAKVRELISAGESFIATLNESTGYENVALINDKYEGQSKNNEPKSLLAIFVAIKSKVIHQKKAQG